MVSLTFFNCKAFFFVTTYVPALCFSKANIFAYVSDAELSLLVQIPLVLIHRHFTRSPLVNSLGNLMLCYNLMN